MKYLSLNEYLKREFGCKVYKLAIDGGFTCPNRDGTLGSRGCIFCSGYGSGDFASSRNLSITEQIESAKERVSGKIKDGKYIAYFQAFTNTYAPASELRSKFSEAINHPDIAAISIGTRPDCLPKDVLDLLEELNMIKPVWIELGLQTVHESSAEFIRRGYKLGVYDKAVKELHERGIYVVTHVILGLPGETEDMMLDTVRYVCNLGTDGIKLQLLHIIKGTDLADLFMHMGDRPLSARECERGTDPYPARECEGGTDPYPEAKMHKGTDPYPEIRVMELDEYAALIRKCVEIIPDNIAIHRLTGDGDKKTLLAPLWSGDKKRVLNTITKVLAD